MYPGYGMVVGGWRGYTGYPPSHSRDPYLVIFRLKGPTHGQMKVNLRLFNEVSQIDLRLTSESTPFDPQIDPPDHPPRRSPDGPQIPDIQTSDITWSRIGSF